MSTAVSLDVDMLSGLPAKALLALVTKHREAQRFFEQSQRALRDFPALFLLLEDMDIDVRFDPDLKLISISFSGDGPRLGKVWAELRRCGYSCARRPKKGDTEFSGSFEHQGYPMICVHFTSALCRRVQVGTRMVEQPIYETRCGDALPEIESGDTPTLAAPAPSDSSADAGDIPF